MSDQLRSIFARWQHLEGEKAVISDDLKELFAEAKGNGYDTKALRAAFRIRNKTEDELAAEGELQQVVDTYLAALSEKPPARPAPARVENIEKFRSDSPKTRPVIASLERPATAKASAQASAQICGEQ